MTHVMNLRGLDSELKKENISCTSRGEESQYVSGFLSRCINFTPFARQRMLIWGRDDSV